MTYTEYCRRRQAAHDAYTSACARGARARDPHEMVAACRAADAAYLEGERLQGELLRGAVVLPVAQEGDDG